MERAMKGLGSSIVTLWALQKMVPGAMKALELIAKLHTNMEFFVSKLKTKYPNDERIIRLVKGFKYVEIEETTEKPDEIGRAHV